jgi:hypothetical protein
VQRIPLKEHKVPWTTIARTHPSAQTHYATSRRRFGDRQTLVIEFDIDGIAVPDKPDAVIEWSVFQPRKVPLPAYNNPRETWQDPIEDYIMGFHNLVQLVLKYSYMVPEHSERDILTLQALWK